MDAVAGDVGAQVGARRAQRFEAARFQHFHQRAGLGIALAEQQEIKRIFARHDHQIGLHEAARQAGRGAGVLVIAGGAAVQRAQFRRGQFFHLHAYTPR